MLWFMLILEWNNKKIIDKKNYIINISSFSHLYHYGKLNFNDRDFCCKYFCIGITCEYWRIRLVQKSSKCFNHVVWDVELYHKEDSGSCNTPGENFSFQQNL